MPKGGGFIWGPPINPSMAIRTARRIGRWTVAVDIEATRSIYAAERADADKCGCDMCKSYASVRSVAIPWMAKRTLESLGIDPAKEEEVVFGYPEGEGVRFFTGWFHFVGEVLGGAPAFNMDARPQFTWEPITELFSFGITAGKSLPRFQAFRAGPCEAVEFYALVPENTPGFRRLRVPELDILEPLPGEAPDDA